MKKTYLLSLLTVAMLAFPGLALAGGNELMYQKVPQLATLAPTALDPTADFIPVYDASAGVVKKMSTMGLGNGGLVTINGDAFVSAAVFGGRTSLLNHSGVLTTMTMDYATGSGATLLFIVQATNTSNYVWNASGSDVFKGSIVEIVGSNAMAGYASTAGTHITLNGGTKGGTVVGDYIILQDIASGVWAVRGQVTATSTGSTPFS